MQSHSGAEHMMQREILPLLNVELERRASWLRFDRLTLINSCALHTRLTIRRERKTEPVVFIFYWCANNLCKNAARVCNNSILAAMHKRKMQIAKKAKEDFSFESRFCLQLPRREREREMRGAFDSHSRPHVPFLLFTFGQTERGAEQSDKVVWPKWVACKLVMWDFRAPL